MAQKKLPDKKNIDDNFSKDKRGSSTESCPLRDLQKSMGISPDQWPYDIEPGEVAEVCGAICHCKDATTEGNKTGKKWPKKQECVACKFSSGYPLYQQKKNDNVHCENPYDLTRDPPELITSVDRTTEDGAPVGASFWKGMHKGRELGQGNTCRPDIVLTRDNSKPAQGSNIRQVVEIKFQNDRLGRAQEDNYSALNPDGPPPLVLEEKHCQCK